MSTRQRAKIGDESGGWHAGFFAPVDVLAARRRAGATDAGDTIDVSAIESVVLCSPGGLGEVIADEAITPARSDIVCVRTGWSEAVNARPVAAHGHVVADVCILVGMALHAYTTALS